MRFRKKELSKLLKKKKIWDMFGWYYLDSLSRLKQYSSLNCGRKSCPSCGTGVFKHADIKRMRLGARKEIENQLFDYYDLQEYGDEIFFDEEFYEDSILEAVRNLTEGNTVEAFDIYNRAQEHLQRSMN